MKFPTLPALTRYVAVINIQRNIMKGMYEGLWKISCSLLIRKFWDVCFCFTSQIFVKQ